MGSADGGRGVGGREAGTRETVVQIFADRVNRLMGADALARWTGSATGRAGPSFGPDMGWTHELRVTPIEPSNGGPTGWAQPQHKPGRPTRVPLLWPQRAHCGRSGAASGRDILRAQFGTGPGRAAHIGAWPEQRRRRAEKPCLETCGPHQCRPCKERKPGPGLPDGHLLSRRPDRADSWPGRVSQSMVRVISVQQELFKSSGGWRHIMAEWVRTDVTAVPQKGM